MVNKLLYGISATEMAESAVMVTKEVKYVLGMTLSESIMVRDRILGDGYNGWINEAQFDRLSKSFKDLKYSESKEVSQEKALYGDYPIDKERLDQAKVWYSKQMPEIQSFVDILIRDELSNLSTNIEAKIDWLEYVNENFPEEQFTYPTDLADAIIGVDAEKYRFILSKQKTIEIYIERDEMTYEEAVEYLYYNPIRATEYLENGPIWLDDLK